MDERLVPTRDLFLCQPVVIVVFLVAQRLGYVAHEMLLGLAILLLATAASAFFGQTMLNRRAGALNAYSATLCVGALLFWLKWWVLD